MTERSWSLEQFSGRLLDRGIESLWGRLAPLSVGAVASSVVLVTGGALVRGLAGRFGTRHTRWLAVAAVVPVGLWLLVGTSSEEVHEEEQSEGDGGIEGSEGEQTIVEGA